MKTSLTKFWILVQNWTKNGKRKADIEDKKKREQLKIESSALREQKGWISEPTSSNVGL